MTKSMVLLINPGAGSVPARPEQGLIDKLAKAAGWAEVEVRLADGDLRDNAMEACRGEVDYLAIAGGDGTARLAYNDPAWLAERHGHAQQVETDALAVTRRVGREGGTAGDVFAAVQAAYDRAGWPEEWRRHHQGGAAGFAGREWIATPDAEDRVHRVRVGDVVGNSQVIEIGPIRVVFAVENFGTIRQEMLELPRNRGSN